MLNPNTQIGPYTILSLLGRGGMGEVYRARDARLGREVAIKVLSGGSSADEKLLKYFEREARSASALNHPNIVTIYDIGLSDFGSYIAMELVTGDTLRGILRAGPLSPKRMLQIGAQAADGLAKAHAAGIFHRDLKPENLMVTKDGLVKILDFGLAKLAPSDQDPDLQPTIAPQDTEPGLILGTVGYMSPEQAGGRPVDFRSDQFSLGAILYETVTGKRAFERATAVETLAAIIREEPEPIASLSPQTPAPCRWVIERCLAKNPDERYASTLDLAGEIRNLRDRFPELGGGETSDSSAFQGSPKRLRVLAALALSGFVLAAATGVLWMLNAGGTLPIVVPLTFGNGHISGARFAADDRSVIYAAQWAGQSPQLYTTDPGNPESRPMDLGNAGIWAVSASGEMAIAYPCQISWGACTGTLAQVAQGGGLPREVLGGVISADWMTDGKTLVVAQCQSRKCRILQYPDGLVLYEAPGWVSDVRVSPDGSRLAFLDHPQLGDVSGSVCVLEFGGEKEVLSSGWTLLEGLAWRPHSDEIWFTGSRVGRGLVQSLNAVTLSGAERPVYTQPGGVWLQDISSDGRRVLLKRLIPRAQMIGRAPGETAERDLSLFDFSTVADLSSDGKTLLFYEWGAAAKGNHTAYIRGMDGSDSIHLGEGKPLALSPNGRWALARQHTLPPQLVLLPTGVGKQRTLPRGPIGEFSDWAAWLPGGERVIFSASEPGRLGRTYIQDTDGGLPAPVTPEGVTGVLISPDARLIAAVDRYGEYYLYTADGALEGALEGEEEGDVLLHWSKDEGGTIFLRDDDDTALNIYKLHLKTGRRTLWRKLTPPYPAGLVGIGANPGEARLALDGQSYVYTFWTSLNELYLLEGLK